LRVIEVVCDTGHLDTVKGLCDRDEVIDYWSLTPAGEARAVVRLLVAPPGVQPILDTLQKQLGDSSGARIVVLAVEATVPRFEPPEGAEGVRRKQQSSREELYQDVERGARLDGTYLTLVVLSTVVAAIGLLEGSVAIVIGAMVIAPLLGPNLALALGTALGDGPLIERAARASAAGIAVALVVSIAIGAVWPGRLDSAELMSRTDVGWDSIALALAAGAAGVLSLTTGLPSVLVGVMVAVALLPPAATLGLMIGAGRYDEAFGAGLLLAVNIVCVNLAAKVVFLLQGVRPRTWIEQRQAKQSTLIYLTVWALSLVLLAAVMYLRGGVVDG
jgi:uncharacterized hydrophobic protein (TIGR00341 family)